MTEGTLLFEPLDVGAVDVLLCDADGNLFGSEEPAFEASTLVTNRLLDALGIDRSYTPVELRRWAMGKNFRSVALAISAEANLSIEPEMLERWVAEERDAVVAQLTAVLRPEARVRRVLSELGTRLRLAVVTSSAMTRLQACLVATELDDLFPTAVRFSAEDTLPVPTSKPDPAIYLWAGKQMNVSGANGLAVEDAVAGVQSAVAAGFPTVGNLEFVPSGEREQRAEELRAAGASAIVPSWSHLARLLDFQGALRTVT